MASVITGLLSGGLLDGVSHVIDSIRGKSPADAAKLQELAMQYQAEFNAASERLQQGQIDVDKIEAASSSTWVAGWRPGIGWTCAAGLFCQFVARPWMIFFCNLYKHWSDTIPVDFPSLDMSTLGPLVLGMLGMTAAHMWENISLGGKK